MCLACLCSDAFLLNLTDGGRSYPSLTDLLLQCRPFMFLYPGISKEHVLGAGAAAAAAAAVAGGAGMPPQGEDSPSHHSPHAHPHPPSLHTHNLSGGGNGKFERFPNNAMGGGVGLFSPPAPGQHGGGGGMGMPPLGQHSFSAGAGQSSAHAHSFNSPVAPAPHRLAHHAQSFPGNIHQLAHALPGSNPNGEGQPPVQVQPRGPSPVIAQQQEGVPSAPGGV